MRCMLMVLFVASFSLLGTGYAQPLDDVNTTVFEFEDSTASIHFMWNHDDTISKYEIGCVTCTPNFSEITINDEIVLEDINILENGFALFYIIAYNAEDSEIITVKQVMLKL